MGATDFVTGLTFALAGSAVASGPSIWRRHRSARSSVPARDGAAVNMRGTLTQTAFDAAIGTGKGKLGARFVVRRGTAVQTTAN